MSRHEARNAAWLRRPGARPVLAAALATSLLLGIAVLLTDTLHSSAAGALEHPAHPVSDEQTQAQVVDSARQIVTAAGLQTTTAGYLVMSCKNQDGPPYQGAVHLTFALPADARTDAYFGELAAKLVSHGWAEGSPPNQHVFGRTVVKDDVTAVIYRRVEEPRVGEMRVYGQCRNINDHRKDPTAWIDITSQFTGTR
ncbi:hypothetical protein [Mycobacterium szulgai]|uniref:hypothetical protein n=1 Tax=Mycobacterium szulgai TaxID=1787 RepID=UPI001B804537|nr:hypothetical protein [Mycobacterium szulgai]MCV7075393.1 hypothetical protein [Mycobacterium szulgai]